MNGYFQLIIDDTNISVKLVPPTDGGKKLNVPELVDYLTVKNIEVTNPKALVQLANAMADEVKTVPLNNIGGLPERECFKVTVSPDRTEAVARFYPPSTGGAAYQSKEEIIDDLKFYNVAFGYDEEAIERYLKERNYCEDIVVARGKEPIHGKDAWIEYFFDTDLNTRPKRNEDGSVDFFNLNTINHCKVGDLLAKLHPEVPGQPGTDVYGEVIKQRDAKKTYLKFGRNIILSEDAREITSNVNGHVSLTGGKVFVSDVYEVENVGTATGNIEAEGSVLVTGNVQAGFSIKAKGDVEVRGVVEGAVIETDGDIIIARGMNGMGKGILRAGGRIILKYAENATIHSGSYVESESILHSTVNAKTEVVVDGRKGFIAGGVVRAASRIKCKTLGSPMGADTVVEVGVDPEMKKTYQDMQKEMLDIVKNLKNIQPILATTTKKIKAGEKYPPEKMKYIESLILTNKQQTERLGQIQEEMETMDELMKNEEHACVRVHEDAYAGTRIVIGDVSMVLKKNATYCRFVKEQGEIKTAAY
ncbi:MAG: DUF342 domain-containing protein [Lachnospiraceae bacterium]|nr:DUF342 domain-containing protein [Lachnospiraceae bacterium]